MRIDSKRAWSEVLSLARNPSKDANAAMSRVISICATSFPHADWKRMAELDYQRGVDELVGWLPSVLRREPPQIRVAGFWFGLFNPTDENGRMLADIYVWGSSRYERSDKKIEWIFGCKYTPDSGYAESSILRSICEIAYEKEDGLGNDAEWSLAMAFAVVGVQSALQEMDQSLIPERANEIGVAVGFDSGDLLMLGELTRDGFSAVAP